MRCWLVVCWCCLGCSSVVQVGGLFVNDVEDFIVGFHEGLVRSTWKIEGYVKEVYGFLICFDGDFEMVILMILWFFVILILIFFCDFVILILILMIFWFCDFWFGDFVIFWDFEIFDASMVILNFKERYRNHTASFRHQSKRNETELSKPIWALKDNNKPFNIKWRIIKQCRPYVPINPFPSKWVLRALIDFTLSNARRFYSSMGNLLDRKGLTTNVTYAFLRSL